MRLSSGSLFPTFLVGYSSSAFPWRPSSPFFWFVRGVGWSSWLSPMLSARLWSVVSSVPCGLVGASANFPAALLPASLWAIGCSTVSSLGARRCVLSLTLGFSIPLPVSLSWALFSRFLSSAAFSSLKYSLWLLDPAFLLLLCASSSSLLAACLWFLFLRTAFPGPQYVPRFSLLISGLSFSRSPSWFGLELLLVFLSFPLLGFPVLSSPCGVSFLATWSLFLSVHRFLWIGWFVLSPLRWFPPSPPVPRPSLGWPIRSLSLLRLSLFGLFLGTLLFEFSSFSPLVL